MMGGEDPGTVRRRIPATREVDSEEGYSGRVMRLILEQLLRTSCQNYVVPRIEGMNQPPV